MGKRTKVLSQVRASLLAPSEKQREATGRLLHTLSAAAWIGFITLSASLDSVPWKWQTGIKILALFCAAVVLFLVGSSMFDGDEK